VNAPLPPPATVRAALDRARLALARSGSGSLEAQALLAQLLDRPRSWILAHPETPLPQRLSGQYMALIHRLVQGEPLAYLTGRREFFGFPFEVAPEVLIPRPETELLVETALGWLSAARQKTARRRRPIRAVDLGTGCGCIAAALALHRPGLDLVATDLSFGALVLAARNLSSLGVSDRVRLVQADLLAPIPGPIDLLCANLPYIPTAVLETLPILRFEPRLALDGGPDGMRLIARALAQCVARMDEGGLALFEIEASQGESAPALARDYFPPAAVSLKKDAGGNNRLLCILT
jgi:release factor glutamine methyltransferase